MVLKDNHMQVDTQPDVSVGIVSGSQIRFRLDAPYQKKAYIGKENAIKS